MMDTTDAAEAGPSYSAASPAAAEARSQMTKEYEELLLPVIECITPWRRLGSRHSESAFRDRTP